MSNAGAPVLGGVKPVPVGTIVMLGGRVDEPEPEPKLDFFFLLA
jgi:hypothetical protein